jgi:LCP family protein required for cell wall assembly
MEKPQIDFLKEKHHLRASRRSPVLFFGRTLAIIVIIAATAGTVFSYQVDSTSDSTGSFPNISFISTLKHFVSSDERKLRGEENDRVNLLLMGIGGEGHDGPQLSDTIIFTSYRPSDGSLAMMSLPRDMTVPIPGYGYRKVNHANAYGEMNEPGAGPTLASQVIGDVLDEEINYYVRVDFDGFAEFIDAIGGVDVYVDQSFSDYNYPTPGKEYDTCGFVEPAAETAQPETTITTNPGTEITVQQTPESTATAEPITTQQPPEETTVEQPKPVLGPDYSCRYETLTFQEGWTHLDGITALKFSRSRHGNNGEGSDFARSKRQQKIILAAKDKILSASTILNPSRITKMMETLKANVATNLDVWEILRLAKELKDMNSSEITHHVIDASESSPLYATVVNGAYVLIPKNDDWSELQNITENIFTPDEDLTKSFVEASEEKPRFIRVEIQNGTNVSGLAFKTSQLLDGQGFEVVKVGNAASRGYEHTVIYDLTNGQHTEELKALRDYLQADVTLSATGWMVSGNIVPKELTFSSNDYENLATQNDLDFLIILGENASSLAKN